MLRFITSISTLTLIAACQTADVSTVEEASEDIVAAAAAMVEPEAEAELESIAPEAGPVKVGLAGDTPADIARYLLASGASAPSLSPDGSKLAYRSTVTGVPQLWIMPATGGAPKQLTFGNGITFFRWSPDSESLIYGADNNGDEQESYYQINADGSTESLILSAVEGGFRSFGDFSSDGSKITFSSTERNGQDFDIYISDLETGASELIFEGTFGFFAQSFSPDASQIVVAETVGEDSDNLYLLDVETAEMTEISKPSPRANHTDGGVAWMPDGSGFYHASNLDREMAAVMFYDIASGELQTVVDTEYDAADIRLCGPGAPYLVFTENVDGFETLRVQDLVNGEALETPSLPEGTYSISCGLETTRMAIGINGWRTPGDVVVWDIGEDKIYRTYKSNYAGLDPDSLVRPESVRITARDGVEIQGLLYLPREESLVDDGLPPVLFEVHGGPTAQSRPSFDPIVQYHVNRGVAVFEPNVRGSTGFGRTYVTLDDKELRRESVADLIDMLNGLQEDGRVDVDRAAVSGGSYGGYMVNAVLALYPDAFKAGVSRYGVADWVTALQIASPGLKASDRIEYGDITEQKWLDYYTENSPIRMADQIRVPVLYSHGVMDPRIDIYETEVMVRTLRENGIEAPYIRIPDEGHGWRKLSNRLFYYRAEADFLEAQFATE
ncbi:MAG: S9 family peptidase [Henriciella sp.]|nr:S9 family peptidase [Henriciella sp.]